METGGVIEQGFRRFGPYVLLRCSGAGGFGRVDLAVKGPPDLAKVCVVKRMQDSERSPDVEARFRREAHIAVRLAHGAIAQTVGVEEIDGELCLLQEYVDGANLAQVMRRAAPERLPLSVALHIAREVGRGLAYAHGLGIVHRDVTPDNVMLSWSGEVKLIDFGIARAHDDSTLTTAGVVIGREIYTAPEVWAGARADARADIYSLGVVLWQLVTGKEDFGAAAHTDGSLTDARELVGQLPEEVGAVIARSLENDPGRRWQSARELVEALGRLLPHGFEGDSALSAFLARHFDVAKERGILEEDLATAKRVLARDYTEDSDEPEGGRPPRRSIAFMAAIGGVALVAVAGIAAVTRPGKRQSVSAADHQTPAATQVAPTVSPAVTPTPPGPGESGSEPIPPEKPPSPTAATARTPRQRHDHAPKSVPPAVGPSRGAGEGAAMLRRARESWDAGDLAAALTFARDAAARGAGAEAHVLAGTVLLRQGQRENAQRELATALQQDPGNAKAARLLELARKEPR